MDTVHSLHVSPVGVALFESSLSVEKSPRYEAAGAIRTPRHLLVSSEFTDLHPMLVELLRIHLEGGWVLWDLWLQTVVSSFAFQFQSS